MSPLNYNKAIFHLDACLSRLKVSSYRQGGILIQLVFGSNSKACIITASCPGQVDRCLQVAVHLLINGATELGAIITEIWEKNTQSKKWRLAAVDI